MAGARLCGSECAFWSSGGSHGGGSLTMACKQAGQKAAGKVQVGTCTLCAGRACGDVYSWNVTRSLAAAARPHCDRLRATYQLTSAFQLNSIVQACVPHLHPTRHGYNAAADVRRWHRRSESFPPSRLAVIHGDAQVSLSAMYILGRGCKGKDSKEMKSLSTAVWLDPAPAMQLALLSTA